MFDDFSAIIKGIMNEKLISKGTDFGLFYSSGSVIIPKGILMLNAFFLPGL